MDSDIIKGKILRAIKAGTCYFKEICDETDLAPNTVTKYTRELEKDGLIQVLYDRNKRKQVYVLNEDHMDEINTLIEKYLESELDRMKKGLKPFQQVDSPDLKKKPVMEFLPLFSPLLDEEERKEFEALLKKIKEKYGYDHRGH